MLQYNAVRWCINKKFAKQLVKKSSNMLKEWHENLILEITINSCKNIPFLCAILNFNTLTVV